MFLGCVGWFEFKGVWGVQGLQRLYTCKGQRLVNPQTAVNLRKATRANYLFTLAWPEVCLLILDLVKRLFKM